MLAERRAIPSLDSIEWSTVSSALQDAEHAVSWRGHIGWLYGRITGHPPAQPLANPRLDTLRRFVDATRRRRRVAEQLVPAMMEQGFNRAQVDAIAFLSA